MMRFGYANVSHQLTQSILRQLHLGSNIQSPDLPSLNSRPALDTLADASKSLVGTAELLPDSFLIKPMSRFMDASRGFIKAVSIRIGLQKIRIVRVVVVQIEAKFVHQHFEL